MQTFFDLPAFGIHRIWLMIVICFGRAKPTTDFAIISVD